MDPVVVLGIIGAAVAVFLIALGVLNAMNSRKPTDYDQDANIIDVLISTKGAELHKKWVDNITGLTKSATELATARDAAAQLPTELQRKRDINDLLHRNSLGQVELNYAAIINDHNILTQIAAPMNIGLEDAKKLMLERLQKTDDFQLGQAKDQHDFHMRQSQTNYDFQQKQALDAHEARMKQLLGRLELQLKAGAHQIEQQKTWDDILQQIRAGVMIVHKIANIDEVDRIDAKLRQLDSEIRDLKQRKPPGWRHDVKVLQDTYNGLQNKKAGLL